MGISSLVLKVGMPQLGLKAKRGTQEKVTSPLQDNVLVWFSSSPPIFQHIVSKQSHLVSVNLYDE